MRIFLDNSMNRRISVLNFIENRAAPVTIKEISEQTGLSKKTIKLFLIEFEREFVSYGENYQVNYLNGIIKSVQANNLNLSQITSDYLKQTVLYRMLKYIFLNGNLDVVKFCRENFISQATFSRYRKKLETILAQCGLTLSRNNELVGDEIQIRNFFMMFFTHSSEEWEFELKYYEIIQDYLLKCLSSWPEYTKQEQKKIILILFITEVRSKRKKEGEILQDRAIDSVYKQIEIVKVLSNYFSLNKKRDQIQIWDETIMTMVLLYKERMLKLEISLKRYCNFFSRERFSFVALSEILTEQILQTFFKKQKKVDVYWQIRHEVDLFHLQLETCFIDYQLFSYNYDENSLVELDIFEKKIKKETKMIVDNLMKTTEGVRIYKKNKSFVKKDSLVEYLYLMIYSLISQHSRMEAEPIKIVVKNSKIFEQDILKNRILALFGEKIEFVGLSEKPDLIVTDVKLTYEKKEVPKVYITTFSDEENMNIMIVRIVDLIIDRFYKGNFLK